MSCRRALEIELTEFLAEPRAERFADFRDHYPRCRDCASEVRAWSELHARLAAAGAAVHPEPATWVRYQDAPDALPADERRALERHLSGCAACRDEVRALASFSPASLAAPAARASRSGLRDALASLRRLVLHPAFAYALAALLLLPVVRGVDPPWRADAPGGPTPAPPPLARPSPLPAADVERGAPAAELRERSVGQRASALQEAAQRAAAPAPGEREEEAVDVLQRRDLEARRERVRAGAFAQAPAVPRSVELEPGRRVSLPALGSAGEIVLRVPVPPQLADAAAFEVRVADPAGARELRERAASAGGVGPRPQDERSAEAAAGLAASEGDAPPPPESAESAAKPGRLVSVRVPRSWLAPGVYRVELHALPGASPARASPARFELAVGAP